VVFLNVSADAEAEAITITFWSEFNSAYGGVKTAVQQGRN
jgi:hypothetical protein